MTALTRVLCIALLLAGTAAAETKRAEPAKPTSHTDRKVRGWTIRVDDRLYEESNKELLKQSIGFLRAKLIDIEKAVQADRVEKLREVVIVLDISHGKLGAMQYHPSRRWLIDNGYSGDLVKCVHIPKAAGMVSPRTNNKQPWVILHELAHAYHDQVLDFDNPEIMAAYKAFKASGKYESTLHIAGRKGRHYGLTDQKEFFSELSESYFGMNDFYPFNRAELMYEEPDTFELLKRIWGDPPKS